MSGLFLCSCLRLILLRETMFPAFEFFSDAVLPHARL
jgi:hypothetical protein